MNNDMADSNLSAAKLTHQLTFEGNWPTAVALVGPNRLVAGNRDGQLFLWDLNRDPAEPSDREEKDKERTAPNVHPYRRLDGHDNGITRLLWHAPTNTLISAGLDHRICLWDLTAPAEGKAHAVLDIAQRRQQIKRDKSNEDEILSAPGLEVETQSPTQILEGHRDWINACTLSGDGRRLVSGDDSGQVVVWDFPARKQLTTWQGHRMNGVVSAAVNSDASQAFVAEFRKPRGSFDRPPAQAKIFQLDEGKLLVDLLEVKFPDVKVRDNSYGYGTKWRKWVGNGFVAAAYAPDDSMLAVGMGGETGEAKVHLIDSQNGKEIRTVSNHQYGVCDVKFTPDGSCLLSSGRDTTLKIIQVSDGEELATLGKPRGGQFKDWYSSLALNPDATQLAAADIGGIVHVWRADG